MPRRAAAPSFEEVSRGFKRLLKALKGFERPREVGSGAPRLQRSCVRSWRAMALACRSRGCTRSTSVATSLCRRCRGMARISSSS